jgi:tripartite-type tricarboxylate transporter receptor subunit TctC
LARQRSGHGRVALAEPEASLAKLGLQTKSMTPREFAAKLADEARDWEAAVTESGVKID